MQNTDNADNAVPVNGMAAVGVEQLIGGTFDAARRGAMSGAITGALSVALLVGLAEAAIHVFALARRSKQS